MELLNALKTLRVELQHYAESSNEHYDYEKFVLKLIEKNKVQKKIDDYYFVKN